MGVPDQIYNLQTEISKVKHTLYEGNGTPSVLVRISNMENSVKNLEEHTSNNFNDLHDNIDMKLKQLEQSVDLKLQKMATVNEIKFSKFENSINTLSSNIEKGFKLTNESINNLKQEQLEHEGWNIKTKVAWIALIGSVLTAIISSIHYWTAK